MTLSEDQIRRLVESTSVSAISYQACALIRELRRINDQEFPPEAVKIRDVLLCWPEFILSEVCKIQSAAPEGATGAAAVRVRQLGRLLQELYSYIRYLTASVPRQAPPAVQAALNQLTALHFPKKNGEPVCVIRPQWEYNLKYVPLGPMLKNKIVPSALDPDMELPLGTTNDILQALWHWRRSRMDESDKSKTADNPPSQIAVLSFAGLDTHDALLYPILAHELGHFIDFSHDPPLNRSATINKFAHITLAEVATVVKAKQPSLLSSVPAIWEELAAGVSVCIRELMADLLALRMMGFGFFAAQTEFLKTVAPWPSEIVTVSGYPGTQFRIWWITQHLLRDDFPGNIRRFLDDEKVTEPALEPLRTLIDAWQNKVKYGVDIFEKPSKEDPLAASDLKTALARLQRNAVLRSLDAVVAAAEATVPDATCARLTKAFFERVTRLRHHLPPSVVDEPPSAFAEIMSAGWAYQFCFGEEKELDHPAVDDRFGEYEKTCRLLMKAIELIPAEHQKGTDISAVAAAPEGGAVLSRGHIARRVRISVEEPEHLGIVPLDPSSIEAASLDVRLGNWFVTMRRTRLPSVRLGDPSGEELLKTIGREETFIPAGKPFLIHPGDLVLGATLEFVALPGDLMAFVEGKSRLGRLGLIVATASQVGPGFHGVVVLELANAGTVPLELVPGMKVAQLVFQRMTEPLDKSSAYAGRFYCQIKP